MTQSPIYATNNEVPAVAVEANADEDITSRAKFSKINKSINATKNNLEEELNTEKYKVTMNIDIENIVKL